MLRTLVLMAVAGGVAGSASGQTFEILRPPPNRAWDFSGISADGSRAVGVDWAPTQFSGFRWQEGVGPIAVAPPPSVQFWSLQAISADGVTAFGTAGRDGRFDAIRHSGSGPATVIGQAITGYETTEVRAAFGTGTGAGFVGYAEHVVTQVGITLQEPIRWTPSGGFQRLGTLPGIPNLTAEDVTQDGAVIVGRGGGGSSIGLAFRWTAAGGYQTLPAMPGGQSGDRAAYAVTDDGSWVFGSSIGAANLGSGAVRWDAAGDVSSLDPTLRFASSAAFNCLGDGSLVWGSGRLAGSTETTPWVWMENGGMRTLASHFTALGIAVPANERLLYLREVSEDGRVYLGALSSGSSFIATVPAPSGLIVLLSACFPAGRRRR
jgi:hypothetical protein